MKIGCCVNMVATEKNGIGVERINQLAEAGYDYVELPLAQIMDLTDGDFQDLLEKVNMYGVPCEACNNFFPSTQRITGDDVDIESLRKYIKSALKRVEMLGAKSVVFGSSGAKNVPEGFDMERAWMQIVEVLRIVDEEVGSRDITIAIEPLCKLESNIINTAEEGYELVKAVNRKHIRLLVDFYHLSMEKESQEIIERAQDYLQHMHIANPNGRVYPLLDDNVDYKEFFDNLKKAGYNQRVSVEAYTKQYEIDVKQALLTMRRADEEEI